MDDLRRNAETRQLNNIKWSAPKSKQNAAVKLQHISHKHIDRSIISTYKGPLNALIFPLNGGFLIHLQTVLRKLAPFTQSLPIVPEDERHRAEGKCPRS